VQFVASAQTFNVNNLTYSVLSGNNISVKKLNDCLRANLKLNFKDFVNSYRIVYFKEPYSLIKNQPAQTIDAITKSVGFSSSSSFYVAYKKLGGTAPKLPPEAK